MPPSVFSVRAIGNHKIRTEQLVALVSQKQINGIIRREKYTHHSSTIDIRNVCYGPNADEEQTITNLDAVHTNRSSPLQHFTCLLPSSGKMLHTQSFVEDLSNWMSRLPQRLKAMPIIHLAIPGSHDSGTWSITKHSEFAPDLDASVKKLRWLGCITKRIMSRWSKSQDYNISRQLAVGVRYLDIRIATKISGNDREFYIVHGLYGPKLVDVLCEIVEFLKAHPKEVIIFDCQHFYDVNALDHDRLRLLIMEFFRGRLVPGTYTYIKHLTIDYMNGNNYQVIVIYRHPAGMYDFFPSDSYPTPWPDTTNPDKLTKILSSNLQKRNDNFGYVSQFVLTPKWTTVLRRIWTGTLKKFSGISLLQEKLTWVQSLSPGSRGVNVVIADFVDIFDQDFCRSVINLNKKLVDSPVVFRKYPQLPPVTN